MREITLNRIQYQPLDESGNPKGSLKWFSFLTLFYGDTDRTLNEEIQNSLNPEYTGPFSLNAQLNTYFSRTGRAAFSTLWSLPALPFLTNLPTDGHPEYQNKRDAIIESFPTDIDSNFNTKLDQIPQKKLIKESSLHPALKDHTNPASTYATAEVIDINPKYPPFYNKYVYAKKKAGL